MRILALEPFYGGSHRAFLDGWQRHSRHRIDPLTLSAAHWKWRMRHAPLRFADEITKRWARGERWDAVWGSDMVALAELRGLAPPGFSALPAVLYFHENQLTYPTRSPAERDLHFAMTNFVSAMAAEEIWFNSRFHHDEWLTALGPWLERMPDQAPDPWLEAIRAKARIQWPGVDGVEPAERTRTPPLRILWAARWEFDKNPDLFFEACFALADRGLPFRLDVLGQRFRRSPPIFEEARARLRNRIDHFGFAADPTDYGRILDRADVFVSTADHEFFGIAAVEAMSRGAVPLFPNRLSYPELVEGDASLLYDGSAEDLVRRLERWIAAPASLPSATELARRTSRRFGWKQRAPALDDQIEALISTRPGTLPSPVR